MKVVIAAGPVGSVSAADAGVAIAQGWRRADPEGQLAVVALAEGGSTLLQVIADLQSDDADQAPPIGLIDSLDQQPSAATAVSLGVNGPQMVAVSVEEPRLVDLADRAAADSWRWGAAAHRLLADRTRPADQVVIDLSSVCGFDAGLGLLAGLAGRPATEGPTTWLAELPLLLAQAGAVLAGARLVGICAAGERERDLGGLQGVVSRGAQSQREHGSEPDPALMLATDARVMQWAAALAAAATASDGAGPGAAGAASVASGAGSGAATAIRALGGEVCEGPTWCAEQVNLTSSVHRADLVVTATGSFDFASRGGGVVQAVADWGQAAMRPVIVLADLVIIGVREQRTMGVETAYALRPDARPGLPVAGDVDALSALAERVAHSWRW